MIPKRILSLLGTVAAAASAMLLLTACGEKKPELRIYNWADYFDADTLSEFEKRFNCRIVYDKFDSNEAMYAKLRIGATGYDVVFPTSYQAYMMQQEGMLLPLDKSKLPNLQHIDPDFVRIVALDKGMSYSVPFMTGTTGIAVRSDRVADIEDSWSIYERADLAGRLTLLNDAREVIGAALKSLGYSLNTTNPEEIRAAGEVVKRWKRNIAKFASEEYKSGLASGEFYVVQGYSGDVMQVMDEAEEDTITYILPREGFSFWTDDMVILKDAPNPELAHAFINFLHEPEIAAKNMMANYYLAPNVAAYELVSEEMREDPMVFLSDEDMSRGEQITPMGEVDRIYNQVWSEIKSEE